MDPRQEASTLLVNYRGCCDAPPSFPSGLQLPGVCQLTVLICVPLENRLLLKAAASSKVMSPSQEASPIQRLSIQGYKGQALLPQLGENMKDYSNSRSPCEVGQAPC